MLVATAPQAAAEPLYALGLGRIEARLELVGQPYESHPLLGDEPAPLIWMGLTTSIGLGKGLRVGVAAHFDIAKHTDAFEVLAELGWSAVAAQSFVPPVFTYGATLALGGQSREQQDGSVSARDASFELELRLEGGLVLFEDFRLLLGVGAMFAYPLSGPDDGKLDVTLRTSLIGAVTF